jgi:hypothetical protein
MKRRRIHTWMLGRHLPYVSRHTYEEEDTYIHMRRRIHTWARRYIASARSLHKLSKVSALVYSV